MKERQVWIDYLRSFVIMAVVIHHSALAYTTFAHFNKEAYILSSNPIVDVQRWAGLDLLVYFNDIFFMSLMFLISGFFIISGLRIKGPGLFINDRYRRLFVPFLFGMTIIALIAYYPSYLFAHEDKNIFRYIIDFLTTEYWPAGPAWFIWVLFFFNLIFAWIYPHINHLLDFIGVLLLKKISNPFIIILFWYLITWILYVPMRLSFGPEQWASLGPFDFQISRLLLYFGYFILGAVVGTIPLDKGVLSDRSSFIRNWPIFVILSISIFYLLVNIDNPLKKLVQENKISDFTSGIIYSSVYVASCIFSCAAFLTTAKVIFRKKLKHLDFTTRHSFAIYLIHYIFIIWIQYILLNISLPAIEKFLIVISCTLVFSFLVSHLLHKSSLISRYL